MRTPSGLSTTLVLALLVLVSLSARAWTVQTRNPPFQFERWTETEVRPLGSASKRWRLCTLYPHIKDSYWLSVNFGMVDQADRLGVHLKVAEAGGYHQKANQWQQVEECLRWPADAILLGTVSYSDISEQLAEASNTVPLFGLVNDLSKIGLVARVGVSWYEMGLKAGEFLAARHPPGSEPVKVAWFPGPVHLELQSAVGKGLRDGFKSSPAIELIQGGFGDNDRNIQRTVLQEMLERHKDLDYIVGGAVLAEIAVNELKKRSLENPPLIISHYYSHGIYRALLRGRVLMANTDQMVLHGRLAVDQAVRYLENLPYEKDIGPAIVNVTQDSLSKHLNELSLSPAGFIPTYSIDP